MSYGMGANRKTVDIGQGQIDEFRLEKTNPEIFSRLMQDISSGNASPENYENPIARRMAEKDQASRAKQQEFMRNNPYVAPPPPPAPDGTLENPYSLNDQPQNQPQQIMRGIGSMGQRRRR